VSETTSPWAQAAGQTATSAAPQANPVQPDLTPSRPLYDGRLGDLYAIYLRHVVLMLLTLGWSRFWGRTRLRRYLWNHFALLGDRFEYRGRGIELLIGFTLALLMLAAWGGLMYLVWIYVFHEKPFATFGLFDIFSLSVALIGFPLAYVGHYAGLRYRLSRTRWRGIRCGLAGSAWQYGAMATFLTFVNTFTGQGYARVFKLFGQAHPEIKLDHTNLESADFAPRLVQERKAGVYSWDVTTMNKRTKDCVLQRRTCDNNGYLS